MPMHDEQVIREKIIEVCRLLHTCGYLAAADGNVSYRIDDGKILITPSGKHKGFLNPEEISIITLENAVLEGEPSTERLMHLEVYRNCQDAVSVVHAHPPNAIAWTIAQPDLEELPAECLSEVILAAGRIPIVGYARPGSPEMGTSLLRFLPDHRLFILARHGALSWGGSLMEAYGGMERLEHSAKILKTAVELGGLTSLPHSEIQALRQMRADKGPQTT